MLAFQLVTALDYYRSLLKDIPKAKKRIVIHAMVVSWSGRTEALVPLLLDALSRGVSVTVVGDVFTKIDIKARRLMRQDTSLTLPHNAEVVKTLRDNGARVTYVGKLEGGMFQKRKGRCHSKVTLIDDNVYSFGGVNFSDASFDASDYMLYCKDAHLADGLERIVQDIAADKTFQNMEVALDEKNTMLFDSGKPAKSVIYDQACKRASRATKIFFVSQLCPSGRLAKTLKKTKAYCYFNRPSQMLPPANFAQMLDQNRYMTRNLYVGKPYIHAKFILFEDTDGTKHVLSGSNNFSWRGVAYGTKEIALHSTDETLWRELKSYMEKHIIG